MYLNQKKLELRQLPEFAGANKLINTAKELMIYKMQAALDMEKLEMHSDLRQLPLNERETLSNKCTASLCN